MSFQSKLPNIQTNIFTIMSRLAAEHQALNLSQGFPNFPSEPALKALVSEAMAAGHNQYAPMPGIPELREVIVQKMELLYGATYDPETEVTVTVGASQAIYNIISSFVSPGDEVIIFKPAYDCYEPVTELHGGKPVLIQLRPDFSVDWEEVKQKISPKTRMIIINSPHNPSGSILSREDMLTLESLLKDTDIILLSDEVYEHIIFDGEQHQSAALFPGLAERAFITISLGKTFHNTGWKVGYCLAPAPLMHELRKTHQFNVFCVDHPMQKAYAAYMKEAENYMGLSSFYQQKRDYFLDLIKTSRFSFTPAKGTYFQLLDYSRITDEADTEFASRLVREKKLAAIPISVFNMNNADNKVLRFCFAKTDETLEKAAEIICSI
ncbi:aminotransferase class I/II-fold pyridoxal phosphate-dependent enzyme [Leptobacterium flavescens]|uniref:Aminotransferase class I/II-fold pyridoxal phosphate-dependent enzyme n=1 Tax=Leptobacterium flavescens TaxID=472055 RepID=A0A6P0UQP2_9FLAO|nr:methionine aminotransferase [Leptobacterium flavescens]NER13183.1 aminotransferase class I/II-fold pyridoxal phosphate-dependent enzyme [Leptobacterium flavescens]